MSEVQTKDDGGAAHRKKIWQTFGILLAITALEFTAAAFMAKGMPRVVLYVTMTIVKAFFIVGEFMHLKHEAKSLIWVILIPCVFVVWLLGALMFEGGSIFVSHPAIFGGK
jgi:cytochrome c oxidase subunit IV